MADDILIQTKIPRRTAETFYQMAKKEGISVAAATRRLIINVTAMQKRPPALIKAWVLDDNTAAEPGRVTSIQFVRPFYMLTPIEHYTPTTRTFGVYHVEEDGSIARLSAEDTAYRFSTWATDPTRQRFILAGGTVWKIITAIDVDQGDGAALQLTLALEERPAGPPTGPTGS